MFYVKLFLLFVPAFIFSNWSFDPQYAPLVDGFYSQYGQDEFLNKKFFKDKKNGFFIDIGAHNGIYFSNTYFFEKNLSWRGICIEPNPNRFKELLNNRPLSVCLNCCVSNYCGEASFLCINGYSEMLSGLYLAYDSEHLKRVEKEVKERKKIY